MLVSLAAVLCRTHGPYTAAAGCRADTMTAPAGHCDLECQGHVIQRCSREGRPGNAHSGWRPCGSGDRHPGAVQSPVTILLPVRVLLRAIKHIPASDLPLCQCFAAFGSMAAVVSLEDGCRQEMERGW